MIIPIEIESDLEFLILGPFKSQNAIYIKSKKLSITTVGFSNIISTNEKALKHLKPIGTLGYSWSSFFNIDNRQSRILFLWSQPKMSSKYVEQDTHVSIELDKFIEESYHELNMMFKASDKKRFNELYQHIFTLRISKLLVKCKFLSVRDLF